MGTFSPTPGENEALEKFISELTSYLLNLQNRNEFKDDLSRIVRGAGGGGFKRNANMEQGTS